VDTAAIDDLGQISSENPTSAGSQEIENFDFSG
jgi:hypothetical protein